MLAREGLRVTAVASAEQALGLLERGGSVDVLLSDICLGAGMDALRAAGARGLVVAPAGCTGRPLNFKDFPFRQTFEIRGSCGSGLMRSTDPRRA